MTEGGYPEKNLEQRMREGLERRAASVEVGRAPALVEAARQDAHPRRRRPLLTGLAAASVAVVVLTGVVATRDSGESDRGRGDRVTDPASPPPVTGWRTEYWHDVQVDVPALWGWGGAPLPDIVDPESGSHGEPLDCGADAYVGADGQRFLNGDDSVPYVGRPVYMTDVCTSIGAIGGWPAPTAPYVWLGAPVDPGTVEFDNGYVMETWDVEGVAVSVATKDPALRAKILASAGAVGQTETSCRPQLAGEPGDTVSVEGIVEPRSLTICVYGREQDGTIRLRYATARGARAAQEVLDTLGSRMDPDARSCADDQQSEWVVLRMRGADLGGTDEYVADLVVHLGLCPDITANGVWPLTEANVRPWAVDGIPAYVVGPYGGKGLTGGFFRGILG